MVDGTLWFSNFQDQRLYRMRPGSDPQAITPESDIRFAGCVHDSTRNRLICVREDHSDDGEPTNEIVSVDLESSGAMSVLVEGADFYSSPRLDAEGKRLAWLDWSHPYMPWDRTELWVSTLRSDGDDWLGPANSLELPNFFRFPPLPL